MTTTPIRVLITGKDGQVGHDLCRSAPRQVELIACNRHELDISSQAAVEAAISAHRPEVIINVAAYTAVDRAEKEAELAHQINATGAGNLARAAAQAGARLIHVSTDFVFDGDHAAPIPPQHPVNPLSVYGTSKAEGERQVLAHLPDNSLIVRTSWVYSVTGHNFVKTMLNLMKERDEIRVVSDQVGTPTWSRNLALTLWCMVTNTVQPGIYHWSDAGVTSWYDFTVAIFEEARALGITERQPKIVPISTDQYPTLAKRPAYSVLDTSTTRKIWGVQQEHWRSALRKMLNEYQKLIRLSENLAP